MKTFVVVATVLFVTVNAGHVGFGGGFVGNLKPPIFFDNGNIGVNFAGYHAAAGLGGLLGGGAGGGLHAEAGTPYGQEAQAGLGGAVESGKAVGGLYAGATAGGDVSAAAGLEGSHSASGSYGASFSGASAGGATKYVAKTVEKPVIVETEVHTKPVVQKTYVERTVIPNYVEKKIQVPSYVEKTVRVPTVIEKTVRVPAPPTVIEKTIEVPQKTAVVESDVRVQGEISGGAETVKVGHKGVASHGVIVNKYIGGYGQPGLFGGLFASGGFGGGFGAGGAGGAGVYKARVTKVANADLINNIFNIPISTLKAVNQLVGGLAGGASGSIAVSKQYGTY